MESSPVCVDTDGDRQTWEHVAFGSDDGTLYVLNSADGSLAHHFVAGGTIASSPAVADLNGDGQKEIVFGSDDGNVYCLSFPGCQLQWSHPSGKRIRIRSSPAIADLSGAAAGGLSIVIGSDDGNVYALDAANGHEQWHYHTGGAVESSPAIADLTGGGAKQVIVGSDNGHVYVLDSAGALSAQFPAANQAPIGAVRSSPAIGYIYSANILDITVGSDNGNLYILRYSLGPPASLAAARVFALGQAVHSSPAVAEIDPNPGRMPPTSPGFYDLSEIVVGVQLNAGAGQIVALSQLSNNNPLWQFGTGAPVTSSPAVAELNHAGELEIVFGCLDGSVYCLKAAYGADAGGSYTVNEGEPLVLSATNSVGPPGSHLAYAWDLDGDGVFDDAIGPTATNTWTVQGEYLVSVLVSDTVTGYSDVGQARVAALDVAPTACLGGPTNLEPGRDGDLLRDQFDRRARCHCEVRMGLEL